MIDSLEEEQQILKKSPICKPMKKVWMPIESKRTAAKVDFESILEKNSNDKAATIYIERINYFLKNPPDANWNGVWVMKGK